MASNLFKRGYEAAREEKKRQDEAREQAGKRLFRFFLSGDGAEARVRFLTEEPINFNEHTVKVMRGGKERYDTFLCNPDGNCPYCDNGDRATFKGAFLVWDYTEFEAKDSNGKTKKVKGSLKLYVAGTKVLSQLDRLSNRYGLTKRDYTIVRTGTGTATSYTVEREDEVSTLTADQIKKMLPENLREKFNGKMSSLYAIIEEQLLMYLPNEDSPVPSDDDDDDDDAPAAKSKGVKNLVKYEEDDDDYDYDEDDGDDEEEPPKSKRKPTAAKKGSVRGLFKKSRKKDEDDDDEIPF